MGHHRHRHRSHHHGALTSSLLVELWEGFWSMPEVSCPKCKSAAVEYYDPFFFAAWRTLTGRRRFQCKQCRFVWRKSRGNSPFRRRGLL